MFSDHSTNSRFFTFRSIRKRCAIVNRVRIIAHKRNSDQLTMFTKGGKTCHRYLEIDFYLFVESSTIFLPITFTSVSLNFTIDSKHRRIKQFAQKQSESIKLTYNLICLKQIESMISQSTSIVNNFIGENMQDRYLKKESLIFWWF